MYNYKDVNRGRAHHAAGAGLKAIARAAVAVTAFTLAAIALPAAAQQAADKAPARNASPQAIADWPSHPVRIIVGTPPGQAVDILGRLLADYFNKTFKQSFIVENRAGVGGMIATRDVAHLPADGYTLLVASSGPLVMTPAIHSKMPYDSVQDFAPIANVALTPQMLLVGRSSPYQSVKDVVAAAKAKPGELNFSSTGLGSTSHLAMEVLQKEAGIQLHHVPYKGNQDATTAMVAGDVAVGFDTVPGSLSAVKGGLLRPLAVAAPQRSPFLPDVPTFKELGYPGVEAMGWIGLAAPAGTPPAIVDKLNKAIHAALSTPEFKERFNTLAFVPIVDTPEQFGKFVAEERDRWAKVAHDANALVD
jgi:tripartite-type tricarboxylate transporter receptor subunit TctC